MKTKYENFDVEILSSQEMKIMYYQSPFYKTLHGLKYFDHDSFGHYLYNDNKDKFKTKFVCIVENKPSINDKKELYENGYYKNLLSSELEYHNHDNELNEEKIKNLLEKKIVGVMKISYREGRENISRGLASIDSHYLGLGLSNLFDDQYYKLAKEFLSTTDYENPYVYISDDYSANAIFSTKEKILKTNLKLVEEFPKYKAVRDNFRLYPSNGIENELENLKKLKEYFKDMPFYGKENLFDFFKISGLKTLTYKDDLIKQDSLNQYTNIIKTIENIKSKTDEKKFTFAFSLVSNRRFVVDIENSAFSSFDKKKKPIYGLYFIEYDNEKGIKIIKDIDTVKLNNKIKSNILEENYKFYNSYFGKWYSYNKSNLNGNIDLMFVPLKDRYLLHHHSFIEDKKGMTLDELKNLEKNWNSKQQLLKEDFKKDFYSKKKEKVEKINNDYEPFTFMDR